MLGREYEICLDGHLKVDVWSAEMGYVPEWDVIMSSLTSQYRERWGMSPVIGVRQGSGFRAVSYASSRRSQIVLKCQ